MRHPHKLAREPANLRSSPVKFQASDGLKLYLSALLTFSDKNFITHGLHILSHFIVHCILKLLIYIVLFFTGT